MYVDPASPNPDEMVMPPPISPDPAFMETLPPVADDPSALPATIAIPPGLLEDGLVESMIDPVDPKREDPVPTTTSPEPNAESFVTTTIEPPDRIILEPLEMTTEPPKPVKEEPPSKIIEPPDSDEPPDKDILPPLLESDASPD